MRWFNKWFYRQFCRALHRGAADFPDVAAYAEFLYARSKDNKCDNETTSWPLGPRLSTGSVLARPYRKSFEFNYSDAELTQLEIVPMTGGHVVTFTKESKNDLNDTVRTNYIITADEDFDQALIKLLALERIKG